MKEEQLALDYVDYTHARAGDPATSREAAGRATRFATSHAAIIRNTLVEYGPLTAHEVAAFTSLNYVQVDRRFVDLERSNLATRTDKTRPTPTGGRATVWAAA